MIILLDISYSPQDSKYSFIIVNVKVRDWTLNPEYFGIIEVQAVFLKK